MKRKRGVGRDGARWSYSMICANNINRSMEAHKVVRDAGYRVNSYGAGRHVRIPHEQKGALTYEFGDAVYEDMYHDLKEENEPFYQRNGLLMMLDRDRHVKPKPQRWQNERTAVLARLDVVICFEERIFDAVVEDLLCREAHQVKAVHVVCIDIKDDAENAATGGQLALQFCAQCEQHRDLEEHMNDVVAAFGEEHKAKDIKMLWSLHYL
eukprot:g7642.t1